MNTTTVYSKHTKTFLVLSVQFCTLCNSHSSTDSYYSLTVTLTIPLPDVEHGGYTGCLGPKIMSFPHYHISYKIVLKPANEL